MRAPATIGWCAVMPKKDEIIAAPAAANAMPNLNFNTLNAVCLSPAGAIVRQIGAALLVRLHCTVLQMGKMVSNVWRKLPSGPKALQGRQEESTHRSKSESEEDRQQSGPDAVKDHLRADPWQSVYEEHLKGKEKKADNRSEHHSLGLR